MKKLLLVLSVIILYTAPSFADVLQPNIPREEYLKYRQERLVYKQRIALVKRVCGDDFSSDKECKVKLKQEIKEIEKLIK